MEHTTTTIWSFLQCVWHQYSARGLASQVAIYIKIDELCNKFVEFCVKIVEFCIKNDELCIKHDEFCIINDLFCIKKEMNLYNNWWIGFPASTGAPYVDYIIADAVQWWTLQYKCWFSIEMFAIFAKDAGCCGSGFIILNAEFIISNTQLIISNT